MARGLVKFTVWREAGEWRCSVRSHPNTHTYGQTADEAIRRCQDMLADFAEFQDHLHGCCEPADCSRCKEGTLRRGITREAALLTELFGKETPCS